MRREKDRRRKPREKETERATAMTQASKKKYKKDATSFGLNCKRIVFVPLRVGPILHQTFLFTTVKFVNFVHVTTKNPVLNRCSLIFFIALRYRSNTLICRTIVVRFTYHTSLSYFFFSTRKFSPCHQFSYFGVFFQCFRCFLYVALVVWSYIFYLSVLSDSFQMATPETMSSDSSDVVAKLTQTFHE